jgi:lysozyme
MILGAAGLALIKSFEQCKLAAYQDPRGVWTVGWGHTGPAVTAQSVCSQADADAWLVQDTLTAQKTVNALVDIALTQNQFDALVSFTFNVGSGAFSSSTLLRYVNQGVPAAADEFLRWDHVNGVANAGLARRRAAERALFLTPA